MKKIVISCALTLSFVLPLIAVLFVVYSYHPEVDLEEMKAKYQYPESKYVNVNGLWVHYYEKGEGDTLLLLHGNGGNIHHFDEITEALSQYFKVIVLDYLGHGLTGPDPALDYSNKNMLLFLEGFFDTLNLGRVHIAGNSMGGYWAMLYAQKHPENIEKIVLLDAYGGICPGADYTAHFMPENLPFAETVTAYVFPRFIVQSEFEKNVYSSASATDELVDLHYDMFSIKGNRMYRKYFSQYEHPRGSIEGGKLTQPILMLWGEKDSVHDLCEANDLVSRLNPERFTVMKGIGHLPMLENPRMVEKSMLDFLRG